MQIESDDCGSTHTENLDRLRIPDSIDETVEISRMRQKIGKTECSDGGAVKDLVGYLG